MVLSRPGQPSRPAWVLLCKGILAWEDELPTINSAVNAVFALLICLRAKICNGNFYFYALGHIYVHLNHNHASIIYIYVLYLTVKIYTYLFRINLELYSSLGLHTF